MSENETPIGEFMAAAQGVAALVEEKNKAYGNSFDQAGEFLKLLYPQGLKPEQFHDALTLVRMFDKMKRVATNPSAFGEDPYKDLMGYAILAVARNERNKPSTGGPLNLCGGRFTGKGEASLSEPCSRCLHFNQDKKECTCGSIEDEQHCRTHGFSHFDDGPLQATNKPQVPVIAAQRATGINEPLKFGYVAALNYMRANPGKVLTLKKCPPGFHAIPQHFRFQEGFQSLQDEIWTLSHINDLRVSITDLAQYEFEESP